MIIFYSFNKVFTAAAVDSIIQNCFNFPFELVIFFYNDGWLSIEDYYYYYYYSSLYSYASSAYDESLCDVKYRQELVIQEECLVLNDAKNITGT